MCKQCTIFVDGTLNLTIWFDVACNYFSCNQAVTPCGDTVLSVTRCTLHITLSISLKKSLLNIGRRSCVTTKKQMFKFKSGKEKNENTDRLQFCIRHQTNWIVLKMLCCCNTTGTTAFTSGNLCLEKWAHISGSEWCIPSLLSLKIGFVGPTQIVGHWTKFSQCQLKHWETYFKDVFLAEHHRRGGGGWGGWSDAEIVTTKHALSLLLMLSPSR